MSTNRQLDIDSNRGARKYSKKELIARIAWSAAWLLFRLSPRPCFGFRCWLLRRFGATVGKRVNIYPTATIYFPWNLRVGDDSAIGERAMIYNLGPCSIGQRATISQGAHLCGGSHDYCDPAMPLLKLPIVIGDDAWICADAFLGPGITVSQGAVVGARAVVTDDVDAWIVVAGNPAKTVKKREFRDPSDRS